MTKYYFVLQIHILNPCIRRAAHPCMCCWEITVLRDLTEITVLRDLTAITVLRDLTVITVLRDLTVITVLRGNCDNCAERTHCEITVLRDLTGR